MMNLGITEKSEYRIINANEYLCEEFKGKIISLWLKEGALTLEETEDRIKQILFFVVSSNDEVLGVCSGYVKYIDDLKGNFLMYRSFTSSEYRQKGIAWLLYNTTFKYYNDSSNENKISGIYVDLDNEMLNDSYDKYVLDEYSNSTLIGFNDDNQIRVSYFDGATF
jgi:hypothetical protein